MRNRLLALSLFVAFANGSCTSSARREIAAAPTPAQGAPLFDDLGAYHSAITTRSMQAQHYFDQGLTLIYAFNHAEAIRSFREAARLDPNCAMAWWGVAVAYGPNINRPMPPEDVAAAWDALQHAKATAINASDKERALIAALSKRYVDKPLEDRSAFERAYGDAMREVAKQYPADNDVQTLFAESLMDMMPWDYYEKDGHPKPATTEILAALQTVLKRDPMHPGANHYLIHAVEAQNPETALASADRLLNMCPGAGHLVHMPAHIYLRLGMYREATIANELASRADQSYLAQCNAQGFYPATYYPHNVHFLWYTNAMEGRSAASIAAAGEIEKHGAHVSLIEADRLRPLLTLVYVRFGRWDDVLKQPIPPAEQVFSRMMSSYARGLAFAARGDTTAAQAELDALNKTAGTKEAKAMDSIYLPSNALVAIAQHDLAGHIALKNGDHAAAIRELESAVKIEDELPYMEPPFSYMPQRHGLGAAMLAANRAADAEKVYREDLKRNPQNGWSLFGLTQSLRAQGKNDLADAFQERFDQAWIRSDVKITSSRF